ALYQIAAMPSLRQSVQAASATATSTQPAERPAFSIWSMTDLATYRLTSAVELYAADGRAVDRFASLPEYTTSRYFASSCNWEAFDEGAPFGSTVSPVMRASRGH